MQESDLLCHSTTKDGLLHVMEEAELITWGKWQMIDSRLCEGTGMECMLIAP